ncbi:MAG: SGNH/GDSL hydrolase family protein [Janthinobacterium lividum]
MKAISKAVLLFLASVATLPAVAENTILASLSPAITSAGAVDPKWADSFAEFSAADKASMPAAGGVLFVGSSSIRLWEHIDQQFSEAPVVINRGFGGSRMEDCAKNLGRLVTPYKPRLVVVYAGDNDLAEGRSPEQVLRSFATFVEGVRSGLPNARIAYVSIKPSVARASLLPQIRSTNALLKDYVHTLPNVEYIDIFNAMLDANGAPRADLFREDKLHMNAAGYAIWRQAIAPSLRVGQGTATASAAVRPASPLAKVPAVANAVQGNLVR